MQLDLTNQKLISQVKACQRREAGMLGDGVALSRILHNRCSLACPIRIKYGVCKPVLRRKVLDDNQ